MLTHLRRYLRENACRQSLAACLLISLGLTCIAPVSADSLSQQLPNIGDAGMSTLSPAEERQLGREFMRSVRTSMPILEDPLTQRYLQALADRLISHYPYYDQTIQVFIVNDPSINAFAGPGGYIGIHTGLIMTANNEAELASVLAHEIGHVVQRHLVRRFEASSRLQLPTMGAILAAILVGGSNAQAANALLSTAVAGNIQEQLSYSRDNEQEADRVGLDLLASADYNPRAMPAFFEELSLRQRIGQTNTPEYFRTHPLTGSRVADTRNRAELFPNKGDIDNLNFQLAKARVASLAPQSLAQSDYGQTVKAGQLPETALAYYHVLSAMHGDAMADARTGISRLQAADKHSVIYPYTAAEIELAAKRPEAAHSILVDALRLFPGNLALTEIEARSLIAMDRPEQAYTTLKAILPQAGIQDWIYARYAQAASAAGHQGEGYRALAELSYTQGNTRLAADYLEQALKLDTITPRERLAYQARLEAIRAELIPDKAAPPPR